MSIVNKSKITILISPTKLCNLRCTYCYLSNTVKEDKTILSLPLFKKIIKKIIIDNPKLKNLFIMWHGGEPLFVGLNFYKKIIIIEKEIERKYNLKITNGIQTNGTLITSEFASFFKKNNFECGISLDGPEYLNNKNRYYSNKKGSFTDTKKGIINLRNKKCKLSFLCIVTKEHIGKTKELYNFYKSLSARSIKFNSFFITDLKSKELKRLSISAKEYNDFLIELFKLYIMDKNKIAVSPIDEIIRAIVYGKTKICAYSQDCAGHFLSVNPNGDVFYCNRLTTPDFKLGNLNINKFNNLIAKSKRKINKKDLSTSCLKCKFKLICWGGCPAIYYFSHNTSTNHKDPHCLFKTFNYISKYLTKLKITKKSIVIPSTSL